MLKSIFALSFLLLASFWISWLTVMLIQRRFNQHLLDIPNERSSHTQPTPRGGGLGFIIGFALTSFLASTLYHFFPQLFPRQFIPSNLGETFQETAILWLILAPLSIIGILDDSFADRQYGEGIPAKTRYLVQLGITMVAIWHFGPFPYPGLTDFGITGYIIAVTLTGIGMTAWINFYNFMDGLDGLVAGVTAIQLGFLALWFNQPMLWLLVAAILGFLWWNWSPAQIFMGDVGSTVLGAMVTLSLLNHTGNLVHTWSAVPILLPIIGDAIYTLVRRILRRENIFQAHRSHLYQRLQQSGWSHAQVAITYMMMTLVIAIGISLFESVGAWLSWVGITAAIYLGELHLQAQNRKNNFA